MKTKKSIFLLAIYILLGVVFTVFFTACIFGDEDPQIIRVSSLSDAKKKLADYSFSDVGLSPEKPVEIYVNFDIGNLSQPGSYLQLIEIIGDSGLYARLILPSKMGGTTVFTSPPLNNAIKGMDKIVYISLPSVTTSIIADKNGISPFFFYENLIGVGSSLSNPKLTEIGDYALSSCKKLGGMNIGLTAVKTIGREAFRGCENFRSISFGTSLETIGDNAFYDCNAFEIIVMKGKPPKLGESVFLGNTPAALTLYIEPEHEALYRAWLADNASKFNNNGEDIIFNVSSIY